MMQNLHPNCKDILKITLNSHKSRTPKPYFPINYDLMNFILTRQELPI